MISARQGREQRGDGTIRRSEECLFAIKNNLSSDISASPGVGFQTYGVCTGRGWEKILIFLRQMSFLVSWGIEKIPVCILIAGIQLEFQKCQTTGLPSPLSLNSLTCSASWYLHQMSFFPHNIFPSPVRIVLPCNRVNNYCPPYRLMSSDI